MTASRWTRWWCASTLAIGLTACTEQTFEDSVSRASLEEEVLALYPPEDSSVEFAVDCEAGLAARVDATTTCRIARTDDETKDRPVRVSVSEVDEGETRIETTPFVPADQVAAEILDSLVADDYLVSEVNCDDVLEGTVGATVACRASPTTENDSGEIVATVSRVSGLRVVFDYEVEGRE